MYPLILLLVTGHFWSPNFTFLAILLFTSFYFFCYTVVYLHMDRESAINKNKLHHQQTLSMLGQCWPNGSLQTTTQVKYLYILSMLGRCWANSGFLFKMAASNSRGFCET